MHCIHYVHLNWPLQPTPLNLKLSSLLHASSWESHVWCMVCQYCNTTACWSCIFRALSGLKNNFSVLNGFKFRCDIYVHFPACTNSLTHSNPLCCHWAWCGETWWNEDSLQACVQDVESMEWDDTWLKLASFSSPEPMIMIALSY